MSRTREEYMEEMKSDERAKKRLAIKDAIAAWEKIQDGARELLAAYDAGDLNEIQPDSILNVLPASIDEWILQIGDHIDDWENQ